MQENARRFPLIQQPLARVQGQERGKCDMLCQVSERRIQSGKSTPFRCQSTTLRWLSDKKFYPSSGSADTPLHCGICPSTPPSLHDLLPSKVIGKEPSAWASKREAVRLGHAARTFRVNRRQVYSTPSTQCQNPAIRPLMVAMVSWSRSILQEERVAGFREIADWPILGDWIDGPRHHRQGHSGIAGPGGSGRTGRERKESGKAENRGGRRWRMGRKHSLPAPWRISDRADGQFHFSCWTGRPATRGGATSIVDFLGGLATLHPTRCHG